MSGSKATSTGRGQPTEPRRPTSATPVVIARPSKPVSEMTQAELRAFARAFVDAMFGRVDAARAAAEKELADEGTP